LCLGNGDFRGGLVADRHDPFAVEVQLQEAGSPHGLTRHLAFILRAAFDQNPGRLEGVGMTHAKRHLGWMLAGEPMHHAEHAIPELLDGFVAGKGASPDLVHEPPRAHDRDLPVGRALKITPELRFDKRRLLNERHWSRKLGIDQLSGLAGALEGAMHDPANAAVSQRPADRRRLRSTQRTQVETGQVTIKDAMGILDVGVPHEEHASRAEQIQLIESNRIILPSV
jgi:hypothetical protein